ncbi:uncharacterized protein LOC143226458 isoform X2 [Tachypleus tridentatus]
MSYPSHFWSFPLSCYRPNHASETSMYPGPGQLYLYYFQRQKPNCRFQKTYKINKRQADSTPYWKSMHYHPLYSQLHWHSQSNDDVSWQGVAPSGDMIEDQSVARPTLMYLYPGHFFGPALYPTRQDTFHSSEFLPCPTNPCPDFSRTKRRRRKRKPREKPTETMNNETTQQSTKEDVQKEKDNASDDLKHVLPISSEEIHIEKDEVSGDLLRLLATSFEEVHTVKNEVSGDLSQVLATSSEKVHKVKEEVSGELPHVMATSSEEVDKVNEEVSGDLPQVLATSSEEVHKVKEEVSGELPHVLATSSEEVLKIKEEVSGDLPHVLATSSEEVHKVKEEVSGELPHVMATSSEEVDKVNEVVSGDLPQVLATSSEEVHKENYDAFDDLKHVLPTSSEEGKETISCFSIEKILDENTPRTQNDVSTIPESNDSNYESVEVELKEEENQDIVSKKRLKTISQDLVHNAFCEAEKELSGQLRNIKLLNESFYKDLSCDIYSLDIAANITNNVHESLSEGDHSEIHDNNRTDGSSHPNAHKVPITISNLKWCSKVDAVDSTLENELLTTLSISEPNTVDGLLLDQKGNPKNLFEEKASIVVDSQVNTVNTPENSTGVLPDQCYGETRVHRKEQILKIPETTNCFEVRKENPNSVFGTASYVEDGREKDLSQQYLQNTQNMENELGNLKCSWSSNTDTSFSPFDKEKKQETSDYTNNQIMMNQGSAWKESMQHSEQIFPPDNLYTTEIASEDLELEQTAKIMVEEAIRKAIESLKHERYDVISTDSNNSLLKIDGFRTSEPVETEFSLDVGKEELPHIDGSIDNRGTTFSFKEINEATDLACSSPVLDKNAQTCIQKTAYSYADDDFDSQKTQILANDEDFYNSESLKATNVEVQTENSPSREQLVRTEDDDISSEKFTFDEIIGTHDKCGLSENTPDNYLRTENFSSECLTQINANSTTDDNDEESCYDIVPLNSELTFVVDLRGYENVKTPPSSNSFDSSAISDTSSIAREDENDLENKTDVWRNQPLSGEITELSEYNETKEDHVKNSWNMQPSLEEQDSGQSPVVDNKLEKVNTEDNRIDANTTSTDDLEILMNNQLETDETVYRDYDISHSTEQQSEFFNDTSTLQELSSEGLLVEKQGEDIKDKMSEELLSPSYLAYLSHSDTLIRETEIELNKLHQLTSSKAFQNNQAIYKLAFDESLADFSDTEEHNIEEAIQPELSDVVATTSDAENKCERDALPRDQFSRERSEIVVHEMDSASEAGSEDVELLPHRYESQTSGQKHIYVNKLSLATELLRTKEILPYDDEFKRLTDEEYEPRNKQPSVLERYYGQMKKTKNNAVSVEGQGYRCSRVSTIDSGVQSEESSDEHNDETKERRTGRITKKNTLYIQAEQEVKDQKISFRVREGFPYANVYKQRAALPPGCGVCCVIM